jgi:uncharacterized protein YjbJ (UPF0337 family)
MPATVVAAGERRISYRAAFRSKIRRTRARENDSFCMNEMETRGKWDQIKGKLKQKYGQLTDDDLAFAEGKSDELYGRVAEKLGRTKEQVRDEIEKM